MRWVTQQDHADRFRFAPLQSELTAVILRRHGIDREAVLKGNTVYLVLDAGTERERLLTQSNVTVNILLLLGGRWRVLGYFCGRCRHLCAMLRTDCSRAIAIGSPADMKFAPYQPKQNG